jgi:hypothetical protein
MLNGVHLLPADLTGVIFCRVGMTYCRSYGGGALVCVRRRRGRVPGGAPVDSYVPVEGGARVKTLQQTGQHRKPYKREYSRLSSLRTRK